MRLGKGVAMALLLTTLSGVAGNADIKVEKIGQPCRAKQVLGGCVVRDPESGREWFAITNMNEVSGAELILIDAERDRAELFRAPAGAVSMRSRVERALICATATAAAEASSPASPTSAMYASYASTAACGCDSFSCASARLYTMGGAWCSASACSKSRRAPS